MLPRHASFPYFFVYISMYAYFVLLVGFALFDLYVDMSLLIDLGWNAYCICYDIVTCELILLFYGST